MKNTITDRQFAALLYKTKIRPDGKTARACRLVLVSGEKQSAAAAAIGVDIAAVSRALAKLTPQVKAGRAPAQRKKSAAARTCFPSLSPLDFSRRIASTNMRLHSKTAQAAKFVLVEGMPVQAASDRVRCDSTATYRALKLLTSSIPTRVCPCCGQPI